SRAALALAAAAAARARASSHSLRSSSHQSTGTRNRHQPPSSTPPAITPTMAPNNPPPPWWPVGGIVLWEGGSSPSTLVSVPVTTTPSPFLSSADATTSTYFRLDSCAATSVASPSSKVADGVFGVENGISPRSKRTLLPETVKGACPSDFGFCGLVASATIAC